MSQKTNPLSLRLQKNNQNFSCPWFADFFFTENYHYGFEIENYIASFLRETQYSKAFFSAKNSYKKISILLFLQDSRADKKEKQLSFKCKPQVLRVSKSSSNPTLLKLLQERQERNNINIFREKSFKTWIEKSFYILSFLRYHQKYWEHHSQRQTDIENHAFSYLLKKESNLNLVSSEAKEMQLDESAVKNPNKKHLFSADMMKISFRKQIRNNYLKGKQRYPYSTHLSFFQKISESNRNNKNNRFLVKKDATPKFSSSMHLIPFGCFSTTLSPSVHRTAFSLFPKFGLLNPYKKAISPFFPVSVTFQPIRFLKDQQNVMSLLDQIVFLLEKRVSFRQIKSKLFKDLSQDLQIKGVRISCSGRLGGRSKKAQKAKMQSDSWGETSLNAFSSKLLFGSKSASTSYGKVGVKLWLCFQDNRS